MPREVRTTSVSDLVSHLDKIVEIFGLTDLDGRFPIIIDGFECGEIGAAFVDGHCLGHAILGDRFLKVTPGCGLVPIFPAAKNAGMPSTIGDEPRISSSAVRDDIFLADPWSFPWLWSSCPSWSWSPW